MEKRYYRPYKTEEVKYLQALDCLSSLVWVYDADRWRQAFANKAALKFWGVNTLEEFLEKDFRDNSTATDKYLSGLATKFTTAIKTNDAAGKEPVTTTWTVYPNNTPMTLKVTFSAHALNVPQEDPDELITNGKIVLLVEASPMDPSVTSDIRSFEALRHVSVMVTIYDLKGHVLYRNRASETELIMPGNYHFKEPLRTQMCESHGCKLGFCVKSFMPYVSNRVALEDFINKLFQNNEAKTQTDVHLIKGNRIHLIHGLIVRDPLTGGQMILVCEEDVTQTVLQEKENTEYRLSSKLKDEFLALSSHELKSPLHAIIGLAEQLHDELLSNKVSDESFKNIALIIDSGKRMSLLVNDILDLARLTRSDVVLHTSLVNVHNMVASVLELAKPILRGIKHASAPVELINDVPNDLCVTIDRHRIHQVLQNLVSNAIKFTNWERNSNFIKITAER